MSSRLTNQFEPLNFSSDSELWCCRNEGRSHFSCRTPAGSRPSSLPETPETKMLVPLAELRRSAACFLDVLHWFNVPFPLLTDIITHELIFLNSSWTFQMSLLSSHLSWTRSLSWHLNRSWTGSCAAVSESLLSPEVLMLQMLQTAAPPPSPVPASS